MLDLYVGVAALMLPPILIGAVLLRRQMKVFWFLVALVAVGTSYLVVSGAAQDIGRTLIGGKSTVLPVPVKQ
jgi:hypothetical protein